MKRHTLLLAIIVSVVISAVSSSRTVPLFSPATLNQI
jgi:hypothetical protein